MPNGLQNAPATFQRALDIIRLGVRWEICVVYIDDVMIFSKMKGEHFVQVRNVFTLREEAGMNFKLKKCFFLHERVEYFGHVIKPGRLPVVNDAKSTCAVRKVTYSESNSKLRSFVGEYGVYRRVVKKNFRIASHFFGMLRKNVGNNGHSQTEEQIIFC